jgi:hypothetical protein
MRANRIGDLLHQGKAVLPPSLRPRRTGRARGGDRRPDMISSGLLKPAQQNAGVDGTAIVELLCGFDPLAVYVEKMLAPECCRNVVDGLVERPMQLVKLLAAKRCVGDLGQSSSSLVL